MQADLQLKLLISWTETSTNGLKHKLKKIESIFLVLNVTVQGSYTTFSSLPWSIPSCSARLWISIWFNISKVLPSQIFLTHRFAVCSTNSVLAFKSLIKPFWVLLFHFRNQASLKTTLSFTGNYLSTPSASKVFHWKHHNPLQRIFCSAITELNEWKTWTSCAPVPQSTSTSFSKFRHHKPWD